MINTLQLQKPHLNSMKTNKSTSTHKINTDKQRKNKSADDNEIKTKQYKKIFLVKRT